MSQLALLRLVRKKREMHAGIPLAFYFFFSLGSQTMGCCCSHAGGSSSGKSLWNTPSQTHPERHLLGASPYLVKLTMESDGQGCLRPHSW